jgi:hypothetical protein
MRFWINFEIWEDEEPVDAAFDYARRFQLTLEQRYALLQAACDDGYVDCARPASERAPRGVHRAGPPRRRARRPHRLQVRRHGGRREEGQHRAPLVPAARGRRLRLLPEGEVPPAEIHAAPRAREPPRVLLRGPRARPRLPDGRGARELRGPASKAESRGGSATLAGSVDGGTSDLSSRSLPRDPFLAILSSRSHARAGDGGPTLAREERFKQEFTVGGLTYKMPFYDDEFPPCDGVPGPDGLEDGLWGDEVCTPRETRAALVFCERIVPFPPGCVEYLAPAIAASLLRAERRRFIMTSRAASRRGFLFRPRNGRPQVALRLRLLPEHGRAPRRGQRHDRRRVARRGPDVSGSAPRILRDPQSLSTLRRGPSGAGTLSTLARASSAGARAPSRPSKASRPQGTSGASSRCRPSSRSSRRTSRR